MSNIVFNFTGAVTINVSGATTIALPGQPADASAFVAGPAFGLGGNPSPLADKPVPVAVDPHAEDKAKLLELLNDPKYRFRKIGTLADAIDASESDTEELLETIGARQEDTNDELYGLISRVGPGKDAAEDDHNDDDGFSG